MPHIRSSALLATLLFALPVQAIELADIGVAPIQLPGALAPVVQPKPLLPLPLPDDLPVLPLPVPKDSIPGPGCSPLQGKVGEELEVAQFGAFRIKAPRNSSGNVVPFRVADCNRDGRPDLQIPWSEGDAPVRLDFAGLCKDGSFPTEVRILLVTDNAVVHGYRGGRRLASATARRDYEAQELKLRDSGGIRFVEIVGNQMCLLDVCWECSKNEPEPQPEPQPEPDDCFVLGPHIERFEITERHGIAVTAARDGAGRVVLLTADDCDGDGDGDVFVPWSEAATATELATIRFNAPCDGGVVTQVVLEIGAFAHDVTLNAYDHSGNLADSVALSPSSSMQNVALAASAGLERIELDGAEICIGDICWVCGEPAEVPLEPGCVTVSGKPGDSRRQFDLGRASLVAATHPDFSPRLLAEDCNGDGRTDVFIPWSESSATTLAALVLGNACNSGTAVLKVEMVLELDAGGVVLRAYDADNRLVHTATLSGSPRVQSVVLASTGGIARVEFEGAEICIRELCWECGEPEVAQNQATDNAKEDEKEPNKGPIFQRGDASADGSVDISDALTGLRHLFLGGALTCRKAADTDDNGSLEMADSLFLLNHLFRGGDAPPAPFDSCGPDSTADSLDCEAPPSASCP